ncbi:MAG: LuxR C-terminal-related transcriptional regulator [Kofleriaceae bacterium]|nr:LuxR C-terminal-related transcriptional regulator [Kofleriaceae bacterium]
MQVIGYGDGRVKLLATACTKPIVLGIAQWCAERNDHAVCHLESRVVQALTCRNAIDVVEAAYDLDVDRNKWLERISAAAAPELDRGAGVIAYIADRHTMALTSMGARFVTPELLGVLQKLNDVAPASVKDGFRDVSRGFYAVHDEFRHHTDLLAFWAKEVAPLGFADGIGVHAPGGADTLTLWAPSPQREETATRVKTMWTRVGAHLSAGLRLRGALGAQRVEERAEAIVDVEGRVKHAVGAAEERGARWALREAVRSIERARGPLRRRDPNAALALWTGLVNGRWTLVDYWDHDGRRFFAAHANAPRFEDPRRLREREIAALTLTSEGATPKEIAYALGISNSNARAVLASGVRKLGLRGRADLHRLAFAEAHLIEIGLPNEVRLQVLEVAHRRTPIGAAARLTPSELAVARLAAAGRSNAEIAAARRSSPRTVANQMAAILRKLKLSSRVELAGYRLR